MKLGVRLYSCISEMTLGALIGAGVLNKRIQYIIFNFYRTYQNGHIPDILFEACSPISLSFDL